MLCVCVFAHKATSRSDKITWIQFRRIDDV